MSREAMKLALEALEVATTPFARDRQEVLRAQAALREALAKPDFWEGYVPEPVKPATEESSATQAQQALDKKAENARELGLDYEPAQQEPVAYLCENAVGHQYFRWKKPSSTYKPIALYTSPPAQRTWVGLTDEEIKLVMDGCGEEGDDDYVKPAFDPFGISEDDLMNFARAIEAKLKEKNNG